METLEASPKLEMMDLRIVVVVILDVFWRLFKSLYWLFTGIGKS